MNTSNKHIFLRYIRIMLSELKKYKNRETSLIICGKNKEQSKFMKQLVKDCETKRKKEFKEYLTKNRITKHIYGYDIKHQKNLYIDFAINFWNKYII